MAPEHVIENKRLEAKAAGDPKKRKKLVKKKPPERGFVHWEAGTFERLQGAPAEPLQSSFEVSHGMLLNVLSRGGDGCRAMRELIRDCHQSDTAKASMRRRAFELFRSLVDRNIIEIMPRGTDPKLRVNLELQDDFSLNQTLALYCIDTLGLLDMNAPDYALKLLSLAEAILEDPDAILRKQLDKLKSDKVAEMKAAGIEYEARMDELEKLEYPKPERAFIYDTYQSTEASQAAPAAKHTDITQDRESFKRLIRSEVFRFLRMLANRDYAAIDAAYALDTLFPEARFVRAELETMMAPYHASHQWIRLDPAARAKINTRITETESKDIWLIEQTLVDPEELNDTQVSFHLSLAEARESGIVRLVPVSIGTLLL